MDQDPQSSDVIPSSMDVGSPDTADLDEAEATQLMESPPAPTTSTGSSSSSSVLSGPGTKRGRRNHTTPKTNQALGMYRVSWEQVRLGLDRLVSSKSIAWYWSLESKLVPRWRFSKLVSFFSHSSWPETSQRAPRGMMAIKAASRAVPTQPMTETAKPAARRRRRQRQRHPV